MAGPNHDQELPGRGEMAACGAAGVDRAKGGLSAPAPRFRGVEPLLLGRFRVGSVPYLNAAPLTCGLEGDVRFVVPSKLAEMLQANELDAALVSVAAALLSDRYDILDGVAIASRGEVYSVLLAHRIPLDKVREVYCDTASLTGFNLLRVLLAERGLTVSFRPLPEYASAVDREAVLLIGDQAIDFQRTAHHHAIFDLGTAWFELTGLPFVYAVWALRRGVDNAALCTRLREAQATGQQTLDRIVRDRPDYDLAFRERYLRRNVYYRLGIEEKRAVARFAELLSRHGLGPVYPARYVS